MVIDKNKPKKYFSFEHLSKAEHSLNFEEERTQDSGPELNFDLFDQLIHDLDSKSPPRSQHEFYDEN